MYLYVSRSWKGDTDRWQTYQGQMFLQIYLAAACPDPLNLLFSFRKCTPEYPRSDHPNNPQYSQSMKGGACLCAELLPMGDDHTPQLYIWKTSTQGGCFEGGSWNRRKRPLAATCGHSLGAATCGHSLGAATCGHSLGAATCGHSLGTGAATCGHSSGCEWLRSGRNTWQSWHLEKNRFCWKGVFFSSLEVG